jgi:replicative DNA helicase
MSPYAPEHVEIKMPASVEAEESVIGAVLVHSKKFVDVATLVTADDFYHPALRAIYEAMVILDGDSKPIDKVTVVEQMRAMETFEKLRAFDGERFLVDLMAKVVTVENVAHHAKLVRSKAERRRWINSLREIVAKGYGEEGDEEFFAAAETTLLELTTTRRGSEEDIKHIKAHLRELSEDLDRRIEQKKKGGSSILGISTGYSRLDEVISGLQPGVTLIGARPSIGKTALGMNFIERIAANKTPALVFSLEMRGMALAQRMVAGVGRVDGQRLAQGDIDGAVQWTRISKATGQIVEWPIYVCQRNVLNVMEVRTLARRWRIGTVPKAEQVVVMVDYLQLVEAMSKKKNTNREQDVSEISRGLKHMSMELNCPVIALSQLSRALETRADKRPMLSDLRESGSLEMDSDVVLFIYRDEVYSKDECKEEDKGIAEIIVGKQRNGPTTTVRMAWLPQYARFEPLSERRE